MIILNYFSICFNIILFQSKGLGVQVAVCGVSAADHPEEVAGSTVAIPGCDGTAPADAADAAHRVSKGDDNDE